MHYERRNIRSVSPPIPMIVYPFRRPRNRRSFRARGGFALVITLSLMILLALLAVGLLSLSAVSLRNSAAGLAGAEARANARLAMMMALGDLQKLLGPDRAVTAPADLRSPTATMPLTGVWESWAPRPDESAPNYQSAKQERFRQWLVSDARDGATRQPDYSGSNPLNPVTLAAGDASGNGRILAGRIDIGDRGGFAWHVADEAVKARIDLARDPLPGPGLAEQRGLVAGHRPSFQDLSGGDSFSFAKFPGDATREAFQKSSVMLPKLVSLNQAEIPGGELSAAARQDLTTHSLGVLCDVREGGLKRDLSSAFAMSGGLPEELRNQRLYQSTHGLGGVSDPYWSSLSSYHNLHSQLARNGMPAYTMPRPDAVRVDRHVVLRNFLAAPVIHKFEMMMSIVARDSHGPHVANLNRLDSQRKYMVHLVLLPFVTLHNPYNVELSFQRLNIVMGDMPVALNFFINGEAQNTRHVPINEMWIGTGANDGRGTKAMRFDLANWQYPTEGQPSTPVSMKPGQTLVFSPYLDPNASSAQTLRGSWGTREDLVSNEAKALKLRPGFAGKAVGLSMDYLCPNDFRSSTAILRSVPQPTTGALAMRWADRLHVETAMRRPETGIRTEWDVSARIVVEGREVEYGGMRFIYQDDAALAKHFGEVCRYPAQGSLTTDEFYEPYTRPLKDQSRAKVITAFSTAARTANGGVYEHNSRDRVPGALNTRRDGRLAGKPFLHHNPARNAILVNLKSDILGHHSHELNLQPLRGEIDDVFEIDAFNRGPALTGNSTVKGIKSGALFELPVGPMQSLAGFRRSNAIQSTYLPHPVQPIANSWVPPLIDTATTRQAGVAPYTLLDHSYLANQALYDGYYFSTITGRGNSAPRDEFLAFLDGSRPLLNQAYQPWRPAKGIASKLFSGNTPAPETWRAAAAWQLVRGSFNVNSTSVLAWKAMLSSLADTPIPVLWARSLGLEQVTSSGVAVPSFTMPLAGPAEAAAPDPKKIDSRRANEWNGFRSLEPTELDQLARAIVEEVRTRGPFLSMAEFVNRRLGYNSELTRVGALQAAIDKSGINTRLFRDMVPVRLSDVSDPNLYGYRTPDIAAGNPADGAPGTICQGDLLHILEPRATVRGDTFVIRTAGQACDTTGKVLATAYLEAVVQRVPDFVDPADAAATQLADLTPANRRFGRRFELVSARWLNPREI